MSQPKKKLLDLTLVIIPLITHVFVLLWAIYTLVRHFKSDRPTLWRRCVGAANQCCPWSNGDGSGITRELAGGYEPLMGVTA